MVNITDASKDKSIEFINISSNDIKIDKMEETCDVLLENLNTTQKNQRKNDERPEIIGS